MVCVPLILVSAFALVSIEMSPGEHCSFPPPPLIHSAHTRHQATNSGPLFDVPEWLQVPNLGPNLGTLAAFIWGGLYVLLEPVAGTALAALCIGGTALSNSYRVADPDATNKVALAVHIVCWLLQFVGHGAFEGRAPALLDNLMQALFLAPLFVWLELLFKLGYRPELQARVEKAVQQEIAKFKAQKAGQGAKKSE